MKETFDLRMRIDAKDAKFLQKKADLERLSLSSYARKELFKNIDNE